MLPSLSSQHQDSLSVLLREEDYLQRNLQTLIDAQSESLLSGVAEGASNDGNEEDFSTTGSRTPASASISIPPNAHGRHHAAGSRITTPIRQPTRQKIGLHGARKGIVRAISDLAVLKAEERKLLEGELLEKSSELSKVQALAQKRAGLEGQIRRIEEGEDISRKLSEMQKAEKMLDTEIKELETRLWEMKAKHRRMVDEIQGLDNRVQSQLSSYKAALEMAEKEVRAFLKSPPTRITGKVGKEERSGIWGLPPDRRTLDMAEEHFRDEQQVLRERAEAAETERSALEEGVVVWKDVIREVDELERVLRVEMHLLPPSQLQERDRDNDSCRGSGVNNGSAELGMRTVLQQMQRAKSRLESQLDVAEGRGWKLLICCIGAELEAVIEGYDVLNSALNSRTTSSLMEDNTDTPAAVTADGQPQHDENGTVAAAQDAERDAEPNLARRSSNGGSIKADSGGDGGGNDYDGRGQQLRHLQGGVRLGHHQPHQLHGGLRRNEPFRLPNEREADDEDDEDEGPGPELLISHIED